MTKPPSKIISLNIAAMNLVYSLGLFSILFQLCSAYGAQNQDIADKWDGLICGSQQSKAVISPLRPGWGSGDKSSHKYTLTYIPLESFFPKASNCTFPPPHWWRKQDLQGFHESILTQIPSLIYQNCKKSLGSLVQKLREMFEPNRNAIFLYIKDNAVKEALYETYDAKGDTNGITTHRNEIRKILPAWADLKEVIDPVVQAIFVRQDFTFVRQWKEDPFKSEDFLAGNLTFPQLVRALKSRICQLQIHKDTTAEDAVRSFNKTSFLVFVIILIFFVIIICLGCLAFYCFFRGFGSYERAEY